MSLETTLTDLALARRISWTDVARLVDARDADASRETPATAPETAGRGLGLVDERDVALALYVAGSGQTLGFWDGATAEEAFCFALRIGTNPGDGSGISSLPLEQLRAELRLIAEWPRPTRWIERREAQVSYEVRERRRRDG